MKKFISLILLVLLSCIILYPQDDTARIYFYRQLFTGYALSSIKINIDGKDIGKLQAGERLILNTRTLGSRKITFQMSNLSNELVINIMPGSENYVMLSTELKSLNCRLMDLSTGKNEFNDPKKYPRNNKPVLLAEYGISTSLPAKTQDQGNITAGQVKPVAEEPTAKILPAKELNSRNGDASYSQNNVARVYFYRPLLTGLGSIKIFIDGKAIGSLQGGERLIYEAKNFNKRKITFQMGSYNSEIMADISPDIENYVMLSLGAKALNCKLMEPLSGKDDFNNLRKYPRNSKPLLVAESGIPSGSPDKTEDQSNITAQQAQPVTEKPSLQTSLPQDVNLRINDALSPRNDIARIYFYRPLSLKGAGMAIKIFVQGRNIGNLLVGERLIFETRNFNEKNLFFQTGNAIREFVLDLKQGSENYVLVELGLNDLNCQLIHPSLGKVDFNNLKKYKKNSEPLLIADTGTPVDIPFEQTANNNMTVSQVQPQQVVPQNKPPVQNINLKKLALVIGNGSYQNAGYLRNPTNDAQDISKVLKELGFDVMFYLDLNLVGLKKAIDQFGLKLSKYDVGLFYYAGHGVQSKGFNYFIPVDANLKTEAQVEFDCVNTDRLLALMEDAGNSTNIIILDACRNNPFERSWRRSATGTGLAFMNAPSGSLIAYSTSPGKTASDGAGRNGLYTAALLKHLREPNITIEEMFKKVREDVSNQSSKEQVPWESTSLVGTFYFSVK